ncbi:MAG: hypothetical protein E7Z84_07315 [Methanosphaera stadtmanae]|nr:hypothetical protein [Methanosphaera stadtmanae]
MIIRKLDYLKPTHDLPLFNLEIYKNKEIAIIYVENRGYVLFEKNNEEYKNVFFIKTNLVPAQFLVSDPAAHILNDKNEFIGIISLILDGIYDEKIKEYDKKHPEFVLLNLLDNLNEGNVKFISPDTELYNIVDDGFIRLEISILENKNLY